jgi:hypothetical protein
MDNAKYALGKRDQTRPNMTESVHKLVTYFIEKTCHAYLTRWSRGGHAIITVTVQKGAEYCNEITLFLSSYDNVF